MLNLIPSAPASPPDLRYRLEVQASILNLIPSAPASPPDLRYRLEVQASILNLIPSAPASPPDVRRGYASPFNLRLPMGCAPGSGFAPSVYGPKAEPGAQPHHLSDCNGEA